jgi:hypothetical protein
MASSRHRILVPVLALLVAASLPPLVVAQTWTAPRPTDKVEGGVNWTTQVITASAIGVAPPYAVSPEHGRALAVQAGAVLARQELLAIARGMAIDSRTTVQAAMVANSITEARVSGVIRGAQVVQTRDLGGGAVEVTVAIPATGEFADLLLPRPPGTVPPAAVVTPGPAPAPAVPTPAPPRPSAVASVYTGLVIDARGLGVKPAMAPKVLSEGGQEVYGFSVVDRNWVIQQGMAGYAKDLVVAQSHSRVTDKPLTVKAVAASGTNKTDVVISNADAQLLLGSGQNLEFLGKARVMLVVD